MVVARNCSVHSSIVHSSPAIARPHTNFVCAHAHKHHRFAHMTLLPTHWMAVVLYRLAVVVAGAAAGDNFAPLLSTTLGDFSVKSVLIQPAQEELEGGLIGMLVSVCCDRHAGECVWRACCMQQTQGGRSQPPQHTAHTLHAPPPFLLPLGCWCVLF